MSANATSNKATEMTDLIKKFKEVTVLPIIATPKTKYAIGQWIVLLEKSLEDGYLIGGPIKEIRTSFNEHLGKISISYMVSIKDNEFAYPESSILSLSEYEELLDRLQRNQ